MSSIAGLFSPKSTLNILTLHLLTVLKSHYIRTSLVKNGGENWNSPCPLRCRCARGTSCWVCCRSSRSCWTARSGCPATCCERPSPQSICSKKKPVTTNPTKPNRSIIILRVSVHYFSQKLSINVAVLSFPRDAKMKPTNMLISFPQHHQYHYVLAKRFIFI